MNKKNRDGWAPLDYCTEFNMIQTVKTLVERGADVNTTPAKKLPHNGNTPLITASMHGSFGIVKLFLDASA